MKITTSSIVINEYQTDGITGIVDLYHLFWDDIDKLKPTDFKTEVLFDLVDNLYRQKHGITLTGNYSIRDPITCAGACPRR